MMRRPGVDRVRFSEIWTGQLISEAGNPKRYRVVTIMENPDRITVRTVGGQNLRTIDRTSLELSWFPAGARVSKD